MLRQTTANDGTSVVASATAEKQPRRPSSSRSPGPDAGPRHLTAPSAKPPRITFARCGERPGPVVTPDPRCHNGA
ncbi:hypothetical protein SCP_1700020 [Sparassis crispa]|uniref:Uncharacterized protein n=1 Tax=Sparassis crispa TaxID=139825 RepID=A0A401H5F8_9APHY|nr:hypothetical protein SCP_1700020 [Sparassis crispa]GBE89678.1 hypothetical protein SCP_1700020 [Sparassis crispa]